MYLKLAYRNAKRAVVDYLLYIATMTILIAIMYISNCIAVLGDIQFGFRTTSLPILIVLIMVALMDYINTFMIKQRAKEFAHYLLLGMEKSKLSFLFIMELSFIGIVCFIFGILLGTGSCLIMLSGIFHGAEFNILHSVQSILYTLIFFIIVETLSALRMNRKICRLQIYELMNEKRRNQSLKANRKKYWITVYVISFVSLVLCLFGAVFLSENTSYIFISMISIPLLCCIFSFYQWLYACFSSMRQRQTENIYQGNRLYYIAELTTGTKTSAFIYSIFCVSLLFSLTSFVFGILLLNKENMIFTAANQQWMGILQISICIIFIIIYFFNLSLQQILELKRQAKDILMLHYLGKSKAHIRSLLKIQIMLKLTMPTLMFFVLLLIGTPLINYKLNRTLPIIIHNSLIKSVGAFSACFVILYLCYYGIVYLISIRYIKQLFISN